MVKRLVQIERRKEKERVKGKVGKRKGEGKGMKREGGRTPMCDNCPVEMKSREQRETMIERERDREVGELQREREVGELQRERKKKLKRTF